MFIFVQIAILESFKNSLGHALVFPNTFLNFGKLPLWRAIKVIYHCVQKQDLIFVSWSGLHTIMTDSSRFWFQTNC